MTFTDYARSRLTWSYVCSRLTWSYVCWRLPVVAGIGLIFAFAWMGTPS